MTNTVESLDASRLSSLKNWAVYALAEAMGCPTSDIDTSVTFDILGVDSLEALVLATGFEEEFGIIVDPYWLLEYPSLDLFIDNLPRLLAQNSSPA